MALALAACSSTDVYDGEEVADGSWGIINGSLDTTHQAVVRWQKGGSQCSATIVHVSGSTGYALSAGHCAGGQLGTLRQGNNANNPDRTYTVVEQAAHPDYSITDAYDFSMVRFTGADGSTPVIDVETSGQDNINPGTQLDMVGYGLTETGPTNQRHHIVKPVDWEEPLFIAFDQSTSGMCSGDSGGGVLHSGRVAGVNSFVTDGNCVAPGAFGVAMRVSAVKTTFIDPFINGTPYLDQTCNQCSDAHYQLGFGLCANAAQSCWDNADCDAYTSCVNSCQFTPSSAPSTIPRARTSTTRSRAASATPPAPANAPTRAGVSRILPVG